MSEFNVNPSILLKEASDLNKVYNILKNQNDKIEAIKKNISISGDSGSKVKKALELTSEQLESRMLTTKKIYTILEQVGNLYKKAEQSIVGDDNSLPTNIAFDDEGMYGGNQSNPKSHADELANIVRRYYPDFTDKEVEDYLNKLEDEGCGYVAMINTIFDQFDGKEDEFEETFGFPMYDENGDLNYNAMVTDFYAATDNHYENSFLWFKWDDINESEDPSNTDGHGTSRESREYRWETYMKDHGIDVDVHNVEVTPDTYEQIAANGDLVIAVEPCILYDVNGNEVKNQPGGHAMTVTGVTEDGMYRVSSWGKEFYVKPDDEVYSRMQFQQIEY